MEIHFVLMCFVFSFFTESTPRLLNYTTISGSPSDKTNNNSSNGPTSTNNTLIQEVDTEPHRSHGLIQDLSSTPSSSNRLEVSTTTFSQQKPSFHNDKLAHNFDLNSTDSFNNKLGHMSASQPALSSQVLEPSRDKDRMREYRKSGIFQTSSTSSSQTQIIQVQEANIHESQSKTDKLHPYSSDSNIPKQMARSKSEDHYDSSISTVDKTNSMMENDKSNLNSGVSNHQPLVLQPVDNVKETVLRSKVVDVQNFPNQSPREPTTVYLNGDLQPAVRNNTVEESELREELMSLGSDRGLGSSLYSADSSFDVMEKQMKLQVCIFC